MNRVLIIQTAFLGDVILATPVISELKRIYPNAEIDFLVKKGNETLIANHRDVNVVYVFNKQQGKWKSLFNLIRIFRKRKYDLAINLHRFGSSGIITVLCGAKEKRGFSKNPWSRFFHRRFSHQIGDGTHEVERNLSVIRDLGADSFVLPSLYPSHDDQSKIDNLVPASDFVCIAPASVWFTKQLPVIKWIELIEKQPASTVVYLLGAPGDINLCKQIADAVQGRDIRILAGNLTLLQSAYLMSKAKMNYVNDSGPLHLASAMNAPTTAFFCSTSPQFGFGPLAANSKILERTDLACKPCGLHGYRSCPQGHFSCGNIDLSEACE